MVSSKQIGSILVWAALESEVHHRLNHPPFILSVDDFPKNREGKTVPGLAEFKESYRYFYE